MLGNFTQEELAEAQELRESLSLSKMAMRAHKHTGGAPLTGFEVMSHLLDEVRELQEGYRKGDIKNMLEEAADISGCLDCLIICILRELKSHKCQS